MPAVDEQHASAVHHHLCPSRRWHSILNRFLGSDDENTITIRVWFAEKIHAGSRQTLLEVALHQATGMLGSRDVFLVLKHGLGSTTFLADPFFEKLQSHPLMTASAEMASFRQLALRYATNGNIQ